MERNGFLVCWSNLSMSVGAESFSLLVERKEFSGAESFSLLE